MRPIARDFGYERSPGMCPACLAALAQTIAGVVPPAALVAYAAMAATKSAINRVNPNPRGGNDDSTQNRLTN
jgi:hypothetical protein